METTDTDEIDAHSSCGEAMNNDPLPSSAASQPPTQHGAQRTRTSYYEPESQIDDGQARNDRAFSRRRTDKAFAAKKLRFITDLMSSLDTVVFAELCTLYYME